MSDALVKPNTRPTLRLSCTWFPRYASECHDVTPLRGASRLSRGTVGRYVTEAVTVYVTVFSQLTGHVTRKRDNTCHDS
jgi:hypothetical protein